MKEFEFPNEAYSGLLSIFAMIMGMAYPVIQNAIQNIDERFHSGNLVEMFNGEPSYRWFRIALLASIIFALCSPFVLAVLCKPWTVLTWAFFHSVSTLCLISQTIRLYQVIMIYNRPSRLVKHIINIGEEKQSATKSTVLADIVNYAASIDLKEVYLAAEEEIVRQLYTELQRQNYDIHAKSFDMHAPSTVNSSLPMDLNMAIERLLKVICNKKYAPLYTTDTILIDVFYNAWNKEPISGGVRNIIWQMVSEVALNGNKEWFVRYWGLACHHYVSSRDERKYWNDKGKRDEYEERWNSFREMHFVIGGMLMVYARTKWLRDILFYTNSNPPTYPLLCNSFKELVEELCRCDRKLSPPYVWYYSSQYPMKGIDAGVNSDAKIALAAEKFLAIQFVRLWHLKGIMTFDDPIGLLEEQDTIEGNLYYIAILEHLRDMVNELYREKVPELLGLNILKRKEANDFIENNINNLESENKNIKEHPKMEPEKIDVVIEDVKKYREKLGEKMKRREGKTFLINESFARTLPCSVPENMLLKGYQSTHVIEFGEYVIDALNANIYLALHSFFLSRKATMRYRISYNRIGDALRRLNLDAHYTILCFGYNFDQLFSFQFKEALKVDGKWTFSGAAVEEYPSRMTSILVLRKDCHPYVDIVEKLSDDETEDKIMDRPPLYSNIKRIDGESIKKLYFRVYLKMFYPNDLRFIQIDIPEVFSDNEYDLPYIKPSSEVI